MSSHSLFPPSSRSRYHFLLSSFRPKKYFPQTFFYFFPLFIAAFSIFSPQCSIHSFWTFSFIYLLVSYTQTVKFPITFLPVPVSAFPIFIVTSLCLRISVPSLIAFQSLQNVVFPEFLCRLLFRLPCFRVVFLLFWVSCTTSLNFQAACVFPAVLFWP